MPNDLVLSRFIPYRLSVLTNRLSDAIARQYSERFGLTIPEWRVTAVLGEEPGLSATDITARTAMDKVQVSRAVASLVAAGRVARTNDDSDGRVSRLSLTRAGQRIYEEVAPLALKLEAEFLSVLSAEERKQFDRLLIKLGRQVRQLDPES